MSYKLNDLATLRRRPSRNRALADTFTDLAVATTDPADNDHGDDGEYHRRERLPGLIAKAQGASLFQGSAAVYGLNNSISVASPAAISFTYACMSGVSATQFRRPYQSLLGLLGLALLGPSEPARPLF